VGTTRYELEGMGQINARYASTLLFPMSSEFSAGTNEWHHVNSGDGGVWDMFSSSFNVGVALDAMVGDDALLRTWDWARLDCRMAS